MCVLCRSSAEKDESACSGKEFVQQCKRCEIEDRMRSIISTSQCYQQRRFLDASCQTDVHCLSDTGLVCKGSTAHRHGCLSRSLNFKGHFALNGSHFLVRPQRGHYGRIFSQLNLLKIFTPTIIIDNQKSKAKR